MTVEEIGALMGYPKHLIDKLRATGVSKGDISFALGNGQALNVVERLLRELLFSAGLVKSKPIDVWALACEKASLQTSRPCDFPAFVMEIRQQNKIA